MKERLLRFMAGRYGMDALGRVLNIVALVLLVAGIFTLPFISILGAAVAAFVYFRAFSKNNAARIRENAIYLKHRQKLLNVYKNRKQRFAQRKTHVFFTCASCKKTVRVPKGKGSIEITCPVCHTRFTGRT